MATETEIEQWLNGCQSELNPNNYRSRRPKIPVRPKARSVFISTFFQISAFALPISDAKSRGLREYWGAIQT